MCGGGGGGAAKLLLSIVWKGSRVTVCDTPVSGSWQGDRRGESGAALKLSDRSAWWEVL